MQRYYVGNFTLPHEHAHALHTLCKKRQSSISGLAKSLILQELIKENLIPADTPLPFSSYTGKHMFPKKQ